MAASEFFNRTVPSGVLVGIIAGLRQRGHTIFVFVARHRAYRRPGTMKQRNKTKVKHPLPGVSLMGRPAYPQLVQTCEGGGSALPGFPGAVLAVFFGPSDFDSPGPGPVI